MACFLFCFVTYQGGLIFGQIWPVFVFYCIKYRKLVVTKYFIDQKQRKKNFMYTAVEQNIDDLVYHNTTSVLLIIEEKCPQYS